MRSPVSFNKEGVCCEVTPEKTIGNVTPSKPFLYEYDDETYLAVNTFSDIVELIPADVYESVFVKNDRNNEYYGHYQRLFGRTAESLASAFKDDISSRERSTAVVICPTFDCNCRCIYCYQQKCIKDRETMDMETLEKILSFADGKFNDGFSDDNTIELFGGEPFLPSNRQLIERILEYCRKNMVPVGFTSNLVQMWDYAPLLLKYRGYICNVYTTIDGNMDTHNSRRISLINDDPFSDIVRNVNFLVDCGIRVTVAFNVDWGSLKKLDEFLEVAKVNGWTDNPRVSLEIGRVDDRFFEGCADNIMMESELLKEIIDLDSKGKLPSNIKLAFLKTTRDLAVRFGIGFNQTEYGRSRFNYCWASSPVDRVFYIDKDLNVYRCTYTVGKTSESLGKIDDDIPIIPDNYLLSSEECLGCEIGGYCAGGCANSRKIDKKRMCQDEKKNFEFFVENILVPRIRKIMSDHDAP